MMVSSHFTFVIATQKEKGSHSGGLRSQINAHVATVSHAKKRYSRHEDGRKSVRHWSYNSTLHQQDVDRQDHSDDTVSRQANAMMVSTEERSPSEAREVIRDLRSGLRLPTELTVHEAALFKFFISHGRCLQLGTSTTPRYDPCLDVMQRLLENAPIYAIVHIVMAEKVLCRINGLEFPLMCYRYKTRAFRMMRRCLEDPDASLELKLLSLVQLTILAFNLGHDEEQAMHLRALDCYIDSIGGLSALVDPEDSHRLLVEPRFYTAMYLRTKIKMTEARELMTTLTKVLDACRRIGLWIERQRLSLTTSTYERAFNAARLHDLSTYLLDVMDTRPCSIDAGPNTNNPANQYICSWMLCLTFIEHNMDLIDAICFLEDLQTCMLESCNLDYTSQNVLGSLIVGVTVDMISYVRRNIYPIRALQEVRICQAGVDALKVFAILGPASRLILGKMLYKCALVMTVDPNEEVLTEDFVLLLRDEILCNWLDGDKEPSLDDLKADSGTSPSPFCTIDAM